MAPPRLVSASGLRPLGAFVVIGAVVLAVAARVSVLAFASEANPGRRVWHEVSEVPAFGIDDSAGRPLARFVRRLDLVVSPRSMWQAHTPDHMARVLSAELGGEPTPDELLAQLLPDATDGVIRVDAPGWSLRAPQAVRVGEWILRGRGRTGERRPLPGIWLERDPRRPARHRLSWRPAELLSREAREAHGVTSPIRWTRWIADSLAACTLGPDALAPGDDLDALTRQRAEVWRALMPRGLARAIDDVPAERSLAVQAALEREGVHPHQMKLDVRRVRTYATAPLEVLGDWGYSRPDQTEPEPRRGLERLCAEVLERGPGWLERRPASYAFRQDRAPRQPVRPYFVGWSAGSVPPVFRTTIDVELQRELRRLLDRTLEEHRAALAMGIVLEVADGRVLALDSVAAYDFHGFAPSMHQFTPGSTFKVVTMATALDEGVVSPSDVFDVGYGGEYRLEGSRRTIHEAEGHAEGQLTAAQCLSESMNAGLVQIGLRVDSPRFRERLLALAYGQRPGLGLGPERPGYVPPLERRGREAGRWKRHYTHASVAFGHELSTTLVQHAAALAAILRGGVWKPLSVLESVAQEGCEESLLHAESRRVFSARSAAEVRDMMRLGAREGTGTKVWREHLDMGTKTGTAEKVATETCTHVWGEALERAAARGESLAAAEYRQLERVRPTDHPACYTSSICIFARRLEGAGGGSASGSELMVLVVVEEPRGSQKYGSDVAGPTAIAILEEALGSTSRGRAPVAAVAPGFAPASSAPADLTVPSVPAWREGVR